MEAKGNTKEELIRALQSLHLLLDDITRILEDAEPIFENPASPFRFEIAEEKDQTDPFTPDEEEELELLLDKFQHRIRRHPSHMGVPLVVVTVDMWPGGDEDKKYRLGRMFIWNKGGTDTQGDYGVATGWPL